MFPKLAAAEEEQAGHSTDGTLFGAMEVHSSPTGAIALASQPILLQKWRAKGHFDIDMIRVLFVFQAQFRFTFH